MVPAFCLQIPPIVPFSPTVPTRNCCAVCNLRFEQFHGVEQIIGSIPIRSTNNFNNLQESSIQHWCIRYGTFDAVQKGIVESFDVALSDSKEMLVAAYGWIEENIADVTDRL
jgi:hypothetical protein